MAIGQQTDASGGQAQQKAQEVGSQVQEKVGEVAQQAQQRAQDATGRAREQARMRIRGQVDQRSTDAGEQIASQAGDIRTVAEQLREQGKDKPAQLAEQAAQQTERVGSYLKESDADRILGDAEDFARQRPWAVVAGGIALGFAAARFLKASSSQRYERSAAQPQLAPPPDPVAEQPAYVSSSNALSGDGAATGRRPGTDW